MIVHLPAVRRLHRWFTLSVVPARLRQLAPVLIFTVIALLHLLTLMRYPAPFVDEGWLASRAWAFLETGKAFGPLDVGIFDRHDGYWTFLPYVGNALQAGVLWLYGAPALLPLRLLSLSSGLVLLGAVYVIARRLGGRRLALVSVALVTVSGPFFYSSHLARYDIMTATLGFMAIALCLTNDRERIWRGALGGLLVGIAFETHPNAVIYGPTIVALYFVQHQWRIIRKPVVWAFVVGVLVGLAGYAALHILPYPATYFALNREAFGVTHTPPLLTLSPVVLLDAMHQLGQLSILVYFFLLQPVIIAAIVVLARKRTPDDKLLLTLCTSLALGMLLLIRNKMFYYAILLTPAFDILVARFLVAFAHWSWPSQPQRRVRQVKIVVWGLLCGYIMSNAIPLAANGASCYEQTQAAITTAIKPTDRIMGEPTYWFDLADHHFISWYSVTYYDRYVPGSTVEDAMRAIRPNILLLDGFSRLHITDKPDSSLYGQNFRVSKIEMDTFLNKHATVAESLYTECYGPVEVYRINLGNF